MCSENGNALWGRVDFKLEQGQILPVKEDVVVLRQKELEGNPPGSLLRLTVWKEPGVTLALIS